MDVRGEIQPFSDINALQIFPYPRYACSNFARRKFWERPVYWEVPASREGMCDAKYTESFSDINTLNVSVLLILTCSNSTVRICRKLWECFH